MNVADLLDRARVLWGEAPAWTHGSRTATYAELARRAAALAAAWRAAGLEPGDRVLLLMTNRPELVEQLFACFWGGFVAVPLNRHLHPDEVEYVAGHCRASAAVVDESTRPAAQRLAALGDIRVHDVDADPDPVELHGDARLAPEGPRDGDPDDAAWLFYTSGTTGRPKGAVLTHRNLMAMTWSYLADLDPLSGNPVAVHAAPLTHGSGLYLLPFVARGVRHVIAHASRFDGAEFLDLVAHHRATHVVFLAPTMLNRVVAARAGSTADLSALRSIVVGGAPLYGRDLALADQALGPVVTQIYGQGESPMTISLMRADGPAHRRAAGSTGFPFTGVRVSTVDADGRQTPPGVPGEVVVAGDVVMRGYWDDPAATEAAMPGGRLHTGDIGFLDEAGYLFLTDRSKDLVISGGSNVYPREVEEVLLEHPDVAAVAVVGVPDPEWGEAVCAFVVPTGGEPSEADLRAHCLRALAPFKTPKRWEFVDDLPTNAAGKVLKRELVRTVTQHSERTP